MTPRLVAMLNPLLALFGKKLVRSTLGRWSGSPPMRRVIGEYWHLARKGEPDVDSGLGRFIETHREEIEKRRRERS